MPNHRTIGGWGCHAALILLASSGALGRAIAASDDKPKPIPRDIVKIWTDAGAEFEPIGKNGELPIIDFPGRNKGILAKLPDPGAPFELLLGWDRRVTDADLKELVGLKSLQGLSLRCTDVTGEKLKGLAKLKLLRVDLPHTKVSEGGLRALAELTSLEELNLEENKLTMAGLKELARSKSLRFLNLAMSSVTDEDLKGLAGLTNLQSLNLSDTNVTGSGLGHLPTNLQSLNLTIFGGRKDEKPKSAELKVERLAGLTNLRELDLFGREVTDADLKELARLKKLEKQILYCTKVTEAGVANLRRALPKCEIRFSK